jgi:hypothetical protein
MAAHYTTKPDKAKRDKAMNYMPLDDAKQKQTGPEIAPFVLSSAPYTPAIQAFQKILPQICRS